MKGFINYVFSLDIQIFFIVTHCVSEDSETKRQLIHYYKSNKITEDKIISISLKKMKLKKILNYQLMVLIMFIKQY
jgi:hypothetical protein